MADTPGPGAEAIISALTAAFPKLYRTPDPADESTLIVYTEDDGGSAMRALTFGEIAAALAPVIDMLRAEAAASERERIRHLADAWEAEANARLGQRRTYGESGGVLLRCAEALRGLLGDGEERCPPGATCRQCYPADEAAADAGDLRGRLKATSDACNAAMNKLDAVRSLLTSGPIGRESGERYIRADFIRDVLDGAQAGESGD